MRKIMFFCAWFVALAAMAVPAKRVKRTITLEDGSTKEVVLRGDERVRFYEDAEGKTYVSGGNGRYVLQEKTLLMERWQKVSEEHQNRLLARRMQAQRNSVMTRAWGDVSNPVNGKRKGLVILVNFSDMTMQEQLGNAYFTDFFNKEGFNEYGVAGSVHDYFYECSYGQFDLTFDVVGPVTVSKEMAYYGQNGSNGMDMHPAEMVIEACKLADAQGTDFSQYDWDGDGVVEQVFLVYAGYSEASGADVNTIWPHEYDLESSRYNGDGTGALRVDGVKVNTYAVSSELAGTRGATPDGIGTACHEFSHCLCLPDVYDTKSGLNFGMNMWDVMDTGCYAGPNNIGECPTAYTCYERMYCGWLTPVELTEPQKVKGMKALATTPEAYIIYNQGNRNEYYLLENRQQKGFHAYDPGHGMLVIHVDFDRSAWISNTVNKVSTRQRITLIPADNILNSVTLRGDTWPGTSGKTALTDTSIPAATLYNANSNGKKLMGKPIEDIAEINGEISFTFDGGEQLPQLDVPQGLQLEKVYDGGFAVSWNSVENAESYELELTEEVEITKPTPEQSLVLKEDFSAFNNGGKSDGTHDVASELDDYTLVPGWEGEKLYTTTQDEVKVGSGAGAGRLQTPVFNITQVGMTVVIVARAYKNDTSTIRVGYGNQEAERDMFEMSLSQQEKCYVLSVSGIAGQGYLYLQGAGRSYLSDVMVFDGIYTSDELSEYWKSPRQVETYDLSRATISNTEFFTASGTSYSFMGLPLENSYTIRVRAVASGYDESDWSEPLVVDDLTGIKEVGTTQGNEACNVRIYDMTGRLLDGIFKRGVYIMNGRKVLK